MPVTRVQATTSTGSRPSGRNSGRPDARTELRKARERRGLSLDDVSQQARIPRHYIVALERGDVDVLPAGRFRSAYHRQYRSFLGLPPMAEDITAQADAPFHDEPEVTSTTNTIPRGDEIPTVRLVASGFAFTLLVVLLLRVGAVVLESPPAFLTPDPEEAVASEVVAADTVAMAQSVALRAIEDVRVSVTTDEGVVRKGVLPGGESVSIASDGPITLEIADLTRVRVRYNGSRLEPLHNLSKGWRLVFLPDETGE